MHTYVHADIPNTNTRACLARIPTYLHSSAQRNSIYHAQTCHTTTHSCEQAMYWTHLSVWSVELWASVAAMCCAPSSPMELCPRLYAHVCVRRSIQRTCATYFHSSAQRNSIYHAQACPTTTHLCEQAMYCTHVSVWSVELWASAAAMCCAPSSPMEFTARLYAHVCVRRSIQRTCVAHDARSHTYNRERGHIHPYICACRHTKYKHACMPFTYTYLPS
jgi:hypothetical protein